MANGISENLKEKAVALEATGQVDGSFQIMSGQLLDAVLAGTRTDETKKELQAVKVPQDLYGRGDDAALNTWHSKLSVIARDAGIDLRMAELLLQMAPLFRFVAP